jgi:propanol-preferring alcohol dehydrogenase
MKTMLAMRLVAPGQPLMPQQIPVPEPGPGSVLIAIEACAVCRTDLHLIDGELPEIPCPVTPGHEIVGRVVAAGPNSRWREGQRVGVPWLGSTCGHCDFCARGQENLCGSARFTGYQIDGGFAEFAVADHRYCFALPENADPVALSPLLCAGLIGYRALKMTAGARRLGIYGFGAAAHIVAQISAYQSRELYAFVRPGDDVAKDFALELGAHWAGYAGEAPPVELDAAIIFAPAGELVPEALARVRRGGTVVCGGIHMSEIPAFSYDLLWGERSLCSVANLTRADAEEFIALAPQVPVKTHTRVFDLSQANEALRALREGQLSGAAVLVPGHTAAALATGCA